MTKSIFLIAQQKALDDSRAFLLLKSHTLFFIKSLDNAFFVNKYMRIQNDIILVGIFLTS